MTDDVSIRAAADEDEAGILSVLSEAFGRTLTPEWFAWKHGEGPWGPSRGWVAVDGDQVVGVRLFVPWAIRTPNGVEPIGRAMDGAVAPSAQRRGIFTRLVRAEMDRQTAESDWSLLYSTSVPASRDAYRKLDWSVFTVDNVIWPLIPGRRGGAQLTWDAVADEPVGGPVSAGLATAWSPAALRWRIDPRSGHDYRAVRLAESDHSHGAIVRRSSVHGVPTVVVVHGWGPSAEQTKLVEAAGRELGARAVLQIAGGDVGPGRLARRRTASTISVWAPAARPDVGATTAEGWVFSYADLEGTM